MSARKESTTGDRTKTFFAELKIMDGIRKIFSENYEITSTDSRDWSKELSVKESWLKSDGSENYYLITTGGTWEDIGIESVSGGKKDVRITAEKGTDIVKFTIEEGDYTSEKFEVGGNKGDCQFSKKVEDSRETISCRGYSLTIKSFKDVNDGSMVAEYSEKTTSALDSKTLKWELTIYTPKSSSSRSKSTTVAKCNSILQKKEGEIVVNKEGTREAAEKEKEYEED